MPSFKGVRHFVYEKALMKLAEESGYLKKGTGRNLMIVTVAMAVPWKAYVGMYNVGLYATARITHRVISPRPRNLLADEVGGRRTIRASRPAAPNYGIRRIGGRILGTSFGALMIAEALLPHAMQFQPEPEIH